MQPLVRVLLLLCVLAASSALRAAGTDDLLEPDKAFRFSARVLDASTIEVNYRIADGYYLYRERFRFAAEPAAVKLGKARFPPGEVHEDQFFGRVETYRKNLSFLVPVADAGGVDRLKLKVTSQGCADSGVCYVPFDQVADIRLASASAPAGSSSALSQFLSDAPPAVAPAPRISASASDTDIAAMFEGTNRWLVLASFFGFGLLLAFTPCVLPMIPILSGIIVGEGRDIDKLRALLLSLAYVTGMSITYAAAGVGAAD